MTKFLLIVLLHVPAMSGHKHELIQYKADTLDECNDRGNKFMLEDTRNTFICIEQIEA